jgi:hypothetical protein
MITERSQIFRPRVAWGGTFLLAMLLSVAVLSVWIINDNISYLLFAAVGCAGFALLIIITKDWHYGLYCFFIWIVFEDLIRKFTGNSTAMFFAKDVILGLTYLSMLIAHRERRLSTFKPPFIVLLGIFFAFCFLQAFNLNLPSMLYGLLGLKIYFFYVPLMFAGYALLRSEEDLHKFLMLNMWIALVVAGLGIAQSILGFTFLNPTDLAPELKILGQEVRKSPITHLQVERVTSVYVSDGRFGEALLLFYILAWGTVGYLLFRTKRGRKLAFPTMGVVAVGAIVNGVRHSLIAIIATTVHMVLALIWAAPRRKKPTNRIRKAIRRVDEITAAIVALMTFLYPEVVRARWAFFSESLTPGTSVSEVGVRGWEYPVAELEKVFYTPYWQFGRGIGQYSLGRQYVDMITGMRPPPGGSENGYGALVLELGVMGPILWLLWVGSLLFYGWRVVRSLKGTPLFPIGFAFFWYSLYILVLGFFYSSSVYQNYFASAYLWLTVGMLYRLPGLLTSPKTPVPSTTADVAASA